MPRAAAGSIRMIAAGSQAYVVLRKGEQAVPPWLTVVAWAASGLLVASPWFGEEERLVRLVVLVSFGFVALLMLRTALLPVLFRSHPKAYDERT